MHARERISMHHITPRQTRLSQLLPSFASVDAKLGRLHAVLGRLDVGVRHGSEKEVPVETDTPLLGADRGLPRAHVKVSQAGLHIGRVLTADELRLANETQRKLLVTLLIRVVSNRRGSGRRHHDGRGGKGGELFHLRSPKLLVPSVTAR